MKAWWLACVGAVMACNVEDDAAAVQSVVDPACDEAPVATWETFGRGFVTTYCQGCHASTSHDRRDAPVDVVFDTEVDAMRFADAILASAGSDEPRMPPSGGTTADDRARLRAWLVCFADR